MQKSLLPPLLLFVVLLGLFLGVVSAVWTRTPSVTNRIDAILEADTFPTWKELPSPARKAELAPNAATPPKVRSRFEDCPDGLAIIEMGSSAVPALRDLLVDLKRRKHAAAFLGEIGGAAAAEALLAQWRGLRRIGRQVDVVVLHPSGMRTVHQRYEPEDDGFHSEYIHALCLCGLPVSAEVARDTTFAMDLAEKLHAEGAELRRAEHRGESPDGPLDVEWNVEPVDTACEGLHILGMTGAPEALDLFVRALRSPVSQLAWEATHDVRYLGRGLERILPALGALLENPRLRGQAIRAVAWLTDREFSLEADTPAQQAALAARFKQRLQDLGHLPK